MFNKGLDSSEKQGLLKRLKNIEDKTDNQLNFTKSQENKQAINKLYSGGDKKY